MRSARDWPLCTLPPPARTGQQGEGFPLHAPPPRSQRVYRACRWIGLLGFACRIEPSPKPILKPMKQAPGPSLAQMFACLIPSRLLVLCTVQAILSVLCTAQAEPRAMCLEGTFFARVDPVAWVGQVPGARETLCASAASCVSAVVTVRVSLELCALICAMHPYCIIYSTQ